MIPKLSTKSSPRRTSPIGVFDSGIGGLSVLRELRRALPHERFIFFADQKHVPYGGKTAEQLRRYTATATRFLLKHHCKIIVVACNTGTVYGLEHLRRTYSVPFVGTVPAIKPAALLSATGVVGILSTPATAKSPTLKRLIRKHAHNTEVLRIGCAGLEEFVERGEVSGPNVDATLRKLMTPLARARADVVVLGCTHYPFLKRRIAKLSGAHVIDSGRAIALRTKELLKQSNLLCSSGVGGARYFTNGSPFIFSRVASKLLRIRVRAQQPS